MERPGQASLPLSLGRELSRHLPASDANNSRAPAGEQRPSCVPSGGAQVYIGLLPGQEPGGFALHGGATAHHHSPSQSGLQLSVGADRVVHRVREYDAQQAEQLQCQSNGSRRVVDCASSLRDTRSLAKFTSKWAYARSAALKFD